jgi:hypothetical protein
LSKANRLVEEGYIKGKGIVANKGSGSARPLGTAAPTDAAGPVSETERARQTEHSAELVKVKLMERRWKIWEKLLARDSVATAVGAFLLVSMPFIIFLAMIFGWAVPEVLQNAFLIILGYFFGQTASKRSQNIAGTAADK